METTSEHPEHRCQDCGEVNPAWSADNELWNAVMGGPEGILCPRCFIQFAAVEKRAPRVWRVTSAERVRDLEAERDHWQAEHAALYGAALRLAQTKPGATGRALWAMLGASADPADDERFCPVCFAGTESTEHREKCGA